MAVARSMEPSAHQDVLQELTLVRLAKAVSTEGKLLPTGTKGTIVGRYSDDLGYEVEIFEPFHAVVTLGRDALEQ